jgi:replicative DNA helicase
MPLDNESKNEQLSQFNNWLKECKTYKEYYVNWKWPTTHRALSGTQPGDLILLGSQANHGKSQMMTSMALTLLKENSDVQIVDFTFDDTARKRYTQYAANLSGVDMNDVDYSAAIIDNEDLEAVDKATAWLQKMVSDERLIIFENTGKNREGRNVPQNTLEFVREKLNSVYSSGKKTIALLDALNNVRVTDDAVDDMVKAQMLSERLNASLLESQAIMIASAHLRKVNGRRPELDDFKGSNVVIYDAKVVIGLYNDYKVRRQDATVFRKDEKGNMQPIVEGHFLKSKVSDFNSCIPYTQEPARGRISEVHPDAMSTYLSRIYGNRNDRK